MQNSTYELSQPWDWCSCSSWCVFVTWALTAFVAIYRDCVSGGEEGGKFARGESTTAYEVRGKWSCQLSLCVIEFHATDTCVFVFVFVRVCVCVYQFSSSSASGVIFPVQNLLYIYIYIYVCVCVYDYEPTIKLIWPADCSDVWE